MSHKDALGRNAKTSRKVFAVGGRVVFATFLGALLVVGLGGWASTAQLSGAIIAPGSVIVDQNLKSVQHRDGGIIGFIDVREGDEVKVGQVLFRLDDAHTRAELTIVKSQGTELTAKKARLLAERDLRDEVEFPRSLDRSDVEVDLAVTGELRLFNGNRTHRANQKQQLSLQLEQIQEEITGLQSQKASKSEEFVLTEAEYRKLKDLSDKRLIENSRLYGVERDRSRLIGERAGLDAAVARAKTRQSEIRVQIGAIDENARTEAQRELSVAETKLTELVNRRIALEDRLSRTDIRATISGRINEVKVHTVGGVISPAEVLATIVPESARLKIEVKIPPVSIDQVAVGRPTRLRFTTFNQRTTPELQGELVYVSPATSREASTGQTYYVGHVSTSQEEFAKIGADRLLPGMPVEVFMSTDERTAMSYLLKPVVDQFSRAMRER